MTNGMRTGTRAGTNPTEDPESPSRARTRLTTVERRRPTRRMALYAVLGLVLYGAGANVAAGWVIALAGLVLGTLPWAWLHTWRAARRVRVRRRLPAETTTGLPTAVRVEVRAPTTATLVVRDTIGETAGAVNDPRRGRTLSGDVELERGVVSTGRIQVDVFDPLGLMRVTVAGHVPISNADGRCTVLGAVPDLAPGPVAGRRHGGAEIADTRGGGVEISGVRDHVTGEPIRRVDWRSTARLGRLIIRQFTDPGHGRLHVTIEPGPWQRPTLDRAVAVASGVAATATSSGQAVEIAADGSVVPWGPAARRHLARLPPHAGAGRQRPLAASPTGGDLRVSLRPADPGSGVVPESGPDVAGTGGVAVDVTRPGAAATTSGVLPAEADVRSWLAEHWSDVASCGRDVGVDHRTGGGSGNPLAPGRGGGWDPAVVT